MKTIEVWFSSVTTAISVLFIALPYVIVVFNRQRIKASPKQWGFKRSHNIYCTLNLTDFYD